jgi:RNA polymerase sigma factor (sigma-70 family)
VNGAAISQETGVESQGSTPEPMRDDGRPRPSDVPPACVPDALPDLPADTTADLVQRAQAGDASAQDLLFSRCLPPLRRWARGRLPLSARDLVDTFDIVQDAAISTLKNLERFTPDRRGAFMAYLREAVNNKIKDQLRRTRRRPPAVALPAQQADDVESPLEQAIGREQIARYEAALARLKALDRSLIVARLELQQSYDEMSRALGKPTGNAARAAFVRALEKLVQELDHGR